MNSAEFKDPVSHLCLTCAVVASYSLTQEVTGSNPFTVMKNIFFTKFSKKHLGKTPLSEQRLNSETHWFVYRYGEFTFLDTFVYS